MTDAIAALETCTPMAALTLGTPTNSSGVVENLTCTGGTQTVAFSTFSFSPSGTVPLPSTTTLTTDGAQCAVIRRGTGTATVGGETKSFELTTVELPGGTSAKIRTYETGEIGVVCNDVERDEVIAPASSLASCAGELQRPVVVRDDAIMMLGVQLVDAAGASTELFTCTR